MNKSLRAVFIISISAFLLLELGFYLEGFLQFILFSVTTIILFVMLFLFYGYVKESKKKKSSQVGLFALMLVLPLVSVVFNPTMYFNKVSEKEIVILAWKHPDMLLKNESSQSISLLRDGTYRVKHFGFWMNTVEKGSYHFEGRKIHLKGKEGEKTLLLKRYYDDLKLYVLKGKKIKYKDNYLIEVIDQEYVLEQRRKYWREVYSLKQQS
ncbi:MAG: hypothetical protein EP338_14140 [Bacteroidetes bacterium]|nr:MAG: hypothetical protein EP338_14140 [Bacteroidota bacterium]